MTPFSERAAEMGLDVSGAYKGLFSYSDDYCEVVYRQLSPSLIHEDPNPHDTDEAESPIIGIYTKGPDHMGYQYCGYVSNMVRKVNENDVITCFLPTQSLPNP